MKRFIPIAKIILIFLMVFLILRYLVSNWHQLSSLNIRFNYGYIILSFIFMHLGWMSSAWCWGKSLEAFGYKLPYRDIYAIYFRSMPAKYLPGKVWQIGGMTYMAVQRGVPEGATIGSNVIGQAYSVISGVALAGTALAFDMIRKPGQGLISLKWSALPILAVMLVLVIKPDLSERLMNWGLRLLKRQTVSMVVSISTSLKLFSAFLIPWFLFGCSFWLLANALTSVSLGLYIPLTAILAASTVIGFLAIFTPGGIGVREASIVALMASFTMFPASFALAIGFGYRVVTSIVELIAFGLTWLITWNHKAEKVRE